VYNTAKNAQIKTSLNSTTDDTQLVNDQEKTDVKGGGSSEQEPKDKTPVISVKSTATSVTAGDGTVVKVYVDNISNPNTDGSLYVSVNEGALDLVTGTGIKYIDEDLYDEDHDGEMQISSEDKLFEIDWPGSKEDKYIKFVGATKGTVKFTFHYVATGDVTGEPVVAKDVEKSITIKAASSSGGSSSSSKDNTSSGGGAIASGLVDSGSSYLPNLGFDDLGDVTWAQTAINTLAAKKIVSGVGENKFDPNAALTRAAYAQMLVNAIGHSTDSADTYFDDVPTDAWFYHNVAVASQLGIVSGFGDGTFRPNDLITREQMALMTQKAAVVMGKSLIGADNGTFTDDADIADWSRDAVYTLSDAGIINGMGDGTFGPQANATRAQAAVIIYNAFVK
ncbi:MAG: S-layer homology domain-containing protein, partial [Clostridia bacterium]|nr:S-layer homology domain-containing protein [Clostridia bacterium]